MLQSSVRGQEDETDVGQLHLLTSATPNTAHADKLKVY